MRRNIHHSHFPPTHNTKILGTFKPSKPNRIAFALLMGGLTYALLRYTEKMPYSASKILSRPIISFIGATGVAKITYDRTNPRPPQKPLRIDSRPSRGDDRPSRYVPPTSSNATRMPPLRQIIPSAFPQPQIAIPSAPLMISESDLNNLSFTDMKDDLIAKQKELTDFGVGIDTSLTFKNLLSIFSGIVTEFSTTVNNQDMLECEDEQYVRQTYVSASQFAAELRGTLSDNQSLDSFTLTPPRAKNMFIFNIEYARSYLDILDPQRRYSSVTCSLDNNDNCEFKYNDRTKKVQVNFTTFTLLHNNIDTKGDVVIENNEAFKRLLKDLVLQKP